VGAGGSEGSLPAQLRGGPFPFGGFDTEVALSHVSSPSWEGATRGAPPRPGPGPPRPASARLSWGVAGAGRAVSAAFAIAYFKTPSQKAL